MMRFLTAGERREQALAMTIDGDEESVETYSLTAIVCTGSRKAAEAQRREIDLRDLRASRESLPAAMRRASRDHDQNTYFLRV